MRRVDSMEKTLMLEGLEARGEGDDTGWDGWMASLTQWTWVSVSSGSWWWTGRPGVLRLMGSQRVRHDWATDLIWSDLILLLGFPGGISGKEPASQCRRSKRCWFDLWVGKILWRRACQPTPVFLPGKILWTEQPGGLQSIETHRVRHDWSDWVHTADGLSSNLAWQTKEESSVS